MADTHLASSIFSRKPSEETAVEDIYKTTTDTPVNSFQDIEGTSTSLVDSIGFMSKINSANMINGPTKEKAELLKDTLDSSLGEGKNKEKFKIGDLLKNAKSALSGIQSKTKSVTGLLRDGADAYFQVEGIKSVVKNGNLKDLRSKTEALNSITGKTSVLLSANGAIGRIYGTVVDQASEAGIGDSFKLVSTAVKEDPNIVNKNTVLYSMAKTSMPGAVNRGDHQNVAAMADELGSGSISMINPSAIRDLMKNNSAKPVLTSARDMTGEFQQLQSAYQRIDPNWNKSKYKDKTGKTYNDITKLITASDNIKDIFTKGAKISDTVSTKWYAIADKFKEQKTVNEAIKGNFPMRIDLNNTTVLNDSDPRVLA